MAETIPNLLPQPKVSRYRAQRIQAQSDATSLSTARSNSTSIVAQQQDPLARSRSRYRQKPPGAQAALKASHAQRIPAIPAIPKAHLRRESSRQELSPKSQVRPETQVDGAINASSSPSPPPPPPPPAPHKTNLRVDSATTLPSAQSPGIVQHAVQNNGVSTSPQSPIAAEGLFPPLRVPSPQAPVKLDGPPTSDQIRATRPTEYLQEEKSRAIGFGLFRRKHANNDSNPPKTASSKSSGDDSLLPLPAAADAPVSAVNAGDRRVLLECGTYKMMYPITPTTTSVDLIKSAATTMSDPINVKSAVLLEYFGSVGVHRAIRRYEHIRDVMNSWDHDSQNSLLLIDPGTSSSETELGLTGVPKTKPRDVSWPLYYSQNVGKWDKRIVHLKRDGQISIQKDSKKPDEQINVCHLSDFDIYTPTQEKIKKKVKPPKKHCFAVKSQQKFNMFEDTTNFVHFFCVGEKTVADDFHAAVQSWRSWYLVNVMGEGNLANAAAPPGKKPALVSSSAAQNHRRIDSVDDHYQLGTFSPLVDLDQFHQKRLSSYVAAPQESAARHPSGQPFLTASQPLRRRQQQPELAEEQPLANLKRTSMDSRSGGGPLLRSQTQRRQTAASPERTDSANSNTHRLLVDLSSQRHQLPTKCLGLHHEQALTGAERTPPHNDQANLAHTRSVSGHASRGMHSLDRGQSIRRSRPSTELEPFTGEGLVAQSQGGWGDGSRGRGVLDGAHSNGPMLEMSAEDRFAQGSLLQQVEKRQGSRQLVIDRERVVEKAVKTGERL